MSTISSLKLKRALQTDLLNSFFLRCLVILCSSSEGDPLSPPVVEAACGDHHLTPFLSDFFIINLLMIIATGGIFGRRGQKHTVQRAHGERLLVSPGDFNRTPKT